MLRFVLFLLCLLMAPWPLSAQTSTPMADPPGDDPYTISGVPVDVKAKSGSAARDKAFVQGERDALRVLAFRLTGEAVEFKDVNDNAVGMLVKSLEVDESKVSGKRFVGKLSVHFKPEATVTFLESRGLRVKESNGPTGPGAPPQVATTAQGRTLVLPVMRAGARNVLWEEITPWTRAWQAALANQANSALMMPEGSMQDIASVSASEAVGGQQAPLVRMMLNYKAGSLIVATLVTGEAALSPAQEAKVQLAVYDASGVPLKSTSLTLPAGSGKKIGPWLDKAVADTLELWRSGDDAEDHPAASASNDEALHLTMTVPFSGARQWQATRGSLQEMPGVARFEVSSLSGTRAVVQLAWRGTRESLDAALAERNLTLEEDLLTRHVVLRSLRANEGPPPAVTQPLNVKTVYPKKASSPILPVEDRTIVIPDDDELPSAETEAPERPAPGMKP